MVPRGFDDSRAEAQATCRMTAEPGVARYQNVINEVAQRPKDPLGAGLWPTDLHPTSVEANCPPGRGERCCTAFLCIVVVYGSIVQE
jgi:hypothetical protein